MGKKLFSLCMALALCLSLLPATALAAAEGAPNNLYVGNQNVKSGEATTFWTTDKSTGGLTEHKGNDDNWNVKYDPSTVTLTLKNATIEGEYDDVNISGAGIYAASSSGPVSLNIVLEEENKVSGTYGIDVSSSGGDASLNISGSGSLTVSGLSGNGIGIFMSSQNSANLTIEEASVTALGSQVGGSGVRLITSQTGSPSLTIEVKGGSLQASGETNGIHFLSNVNDATAVANLKVSGNAMVKASSITTTKDGTGSAPELKPAASGSDGTGGIIWDGKNGTVYGSVTLQEDLEIGEGESLTIPDGSSLDMNGHTITVESGGKLDGKPTGEGTVKIAPTITTESLPDGEVGSVYSQTLTATGDPTITWSVTSDTLPAGLTLDTKTGTISGTPTTANTYNFTVTATNDSGNDSKEFTLTIDQQGTIHVTSVSLDKTSLELTEGGTGTLIATVEPNNATNKNVTWESSNTSVATVNNGEVTAVSAGTATITATTEDGGFTADCTVTVSRYSTGGPTTYAVTAPDVENGTVRVSPSRASRGTTVTLTVAPDEGYELESLTVLDSRDNEIALTDKGDGKYTFTMPSGKVTVEASFAEIAPEPLPFGDVDDGDWFADAVRFVYENGMMNGVSETSFAPHATTSRSMIVTILYRLEGEPVVDYAMDFTDVAGDAYYAEAVRWAASEGIVGGYGGGLFGTNDAVTREQLAAILYRYAAYKGYDVSIGEDTNILSYDDFADLSEYAIPAMQWACGAGVITGVTDTTLVPQGEATRAQVAAMLMRFVEAIG